MAVGQLLIAEPHPTTPHKAIVILGRGTLICLLKVFTLGMQAQRDVPPLNEVGKSPLVPLRNRELSSEQLGHEDQIPVCYPQ